MNFFMWSRAIRLQNNGLCVLLPVSSLHFLHLSFQPYEGLKLQDLRRLKDMLIVETADMLQVPLFTAEALLRAHGALAFIILSQTSATVF